MRKHMAALAALTVALGSAACDDNGTGSVNEPRFRNTAITYDQLERLGNPLVSEVFVEKREHGHFNSGQPSQDVAQFRDDIARFITGVAGRDAAYANAVAAALTPDMLIVRMDRAGNVTAANVTGAATVGWLSHALDPANGYGGRKLDGDDAVDKGLSVIFGAALGNTANVSPGLVTDNVPDTRADQATFPYLSPAN